MFSRIEKLVILTLTLLTLSCSNIIHDIIPPDDDEILSFQVYSNGTNVTKSSVISKNQVNITVSEDTEIANLLPVVSYSEKSSGIPFTVSYLHKAFPSANVHKVAMDIYEARKQNRLMDWCVEFIQANPDFMIPELNQTIDFSSDVQFGVIAGDGSLKTYTIKVTPENSSSYSTVEESECSTEKDIIEFKVNDQIGSSTIAANSIDFFMPQDSDIKSLIPQIEVSDGASVLPLTMEYMLEYMDMTKLVSFYSGFSSASNTEKFLASAIKKYGITFPETLTKPIDFSDAVYFIVKADDGSIKLYRATCTKKNSTPTLQKVTFAKISNAGLVRDSIAEKNSTTFEAQTIYPVDYATDGNNLSLIADIIYDGDRLTYKLNENDSEQEFISGETSIPLTITQRSFLLTVYLGEASTTYTVNAIYKEDPDTIRSITDFRFLKTVNSDINATAMAAICNEGDTGLITATVLYSGAKPEILIPTFVTPGTVTIEHKKQISGITSQDFTEELQYLCTSKNGMYCRLYTVRVTFIFVERAEAAIRSFTFPALLNKDLSCDAVGNVNDSTNTIFVEALYHSTSKPYTLIPQFSATGKTTVNGTTQSSGFTEQNFSHAVQYTVQSAEDAEITKTYKIQVNFKFDDSCACSLDTFTFEKSKNSTLENDITATVSQNTMSVFALLPYGTGSKNTSLIPTFTAHGTVTVNGTTQISGASKVDFSGPVTYTVTSANGAYTKYYTVTISESGEIIYVDSAAIGRNNGTSWQDAFISLDTALNATRNLPESTSAELWIADREEYKVSRYSRPPSSFIIRGGFDGSENSISQRQEGKRTKLSGLYSYGSIEGNCLLENLEGDFFISGFNYEDNSSLEIENCKINSTSDRVSAYNLQKLKVSNSEIQGISLRIDCKDTEISDSSIGQIELSGFINGDHGDRQSLKISNTQISEIFGYQKHIEGDIKILENSKIEKFNIMIDKWNRKTGSSYCHNTLTVKDSEISFQSLEHFYSIQAEHSALAFETPIYSYANKTNLFSFDACTLKNYLYFKGSGTQTSCTIKNSSLEGNGYEDGGGNALISYEYYPPENYLEITDSTFKPTNYSINKLIETSGNVNIKNSKFYNFTQSGLHVSHPGASVIVEDNHFTPYWSGRDLVIIEDTESSCDVCRIKNNTFEQWGYVGLAGNSERTYENNTVIHGYMTENNGEKKTVGLKLYGNSLTQIKDKDFVSIQVFGGSAKLENCRIWRKVDDWGDVPLEIAKDVSVTANECIIGESASDYKRAVINGGSLVIASSTINGGIYGAVVTRQGNSTSITSKDQILQATDCTITGTIEYAKDSTLDNCRLIGKNARVSEIRRATMTGCTFEGKFNGNSRIDFCSGTFDGNVFKPESGSTLTPCTFAYNDTTIKNMEFNGFNQAIKAYSSLVIENCSFVNCFATNDSGAVDGGAIYASGFTTVITDSKFKNCHANKDSSQKGFGGAICFDRTGGTASVTDCIFEDCSCKSSGGAIYSNANLTVSGGSFSGCHGNYGGAVYTSSSASCTIKNGTAFTNCSSNGSGGAINFNGTELELSGATFSLCSAGSATTGGWGGAICIRKGNSKINNCTFNTNGCTGGGGAINCDAKTCEIISCTFSGNKCVQTGAGINICPPEDGSQYAVRNCNFQNNQAGINGGNYKGNDISCSWATIVGTNERVDHTATLTLSGNSAADIYTTDKITRN